MRQFKIQKQITTRNTKATDLYLSEISRYPILTVAEEEDLATRSMHGDLAARNRLISCNLRFVVSIANGYSGSKVPLEDLINEGNMGLVVAAEKFDPTRGFKFISYAVWWIRQKMMQYITEHGELIEKPLNITGVTSRLAKQVNNIYVKTGEMPNKEELLSEEGYTDKQIKNFLDSEIAIVKGDSPISSDDADVTYFDKLASDSVTDEGLTYTDKSEAIKRILEQCLPARENQIIIQIYGIGCTPRSLEEIADDMGLTRERVRQLNCKAVGRLRARCSKALREYL